MSITKAERAELRSVVRQQFKVLRAELEQRQIEMHSEVEDQIAEKYSGEDMGWDALQHKLQEIVSEANRAFNDALYEAEYQTKGHTEQVWVHANRPHRTQEKRSDLRMQARTRILAQVKVASLRLDREEADLLRTLSVGALESEEAHAFLTAIPTVGELVPAARVAELEASLIDGDDEWEIEP